MKNALDYCYHTHTTRCGHAYGTDEEYVLSAIGEKYRVLGFSDHIFFPGLSQPRARGEYSMLNDYLTSIRGLKKKYQKDIEIRLGFEAEYVPFYEPYYRELYAKHQLEYMILGHHFVFEGNRIVAYYGGSSDAELILRYGTEVVAAMKTGLFKYVAHPDIYMMGYPHGFDATAKKVAEMIFKTAQALKIPLELNLGGIRGRGLMQIGNEVRYPYPYKPFWALAKRFDVKVIIGIDAHSPNDFKTKQEKILFDIADEYQLSLIDRLSF